MVLAHNGKCAARLAGSGGPVLKEVTQALTTKFGAALPAKAKASPRFMQLCSIWALMVHFDTWDYNTPSFGGAFVDDDVPEISWVCDNTEKFGRTAAAGRSFVVLSTREYAQANKCSQENVPKSVRLKVTAELTGALGRALGLASEERLRPNVAEVQLWGAANPISVAELPADAPFLFQSQGGVGVCGDWYVMAAVQSSLQVAQLTRAGLALPLCTRHDIFTLYLAKAVSLCNCLANLRRTSTDPITQWS
ncbi:unnamed protein product [Chrysoparadoxa australica]